MIIIMLNITTDVDSLSEEIWNMLVGVFHSVGGITFFARLIIPVVAIIIVSRCIKSMLSGHEAPEVWAYLDVNGYGRIPVSHWENTIGRSSSSDIVIDYPTISRSHAVLIRDETKRWTISDLGSTGGVSLNGKPLKGTAAVPAGSILKFSDVEARFLVTRPKGFQKETNKKVARILRPVHTLTLLSVFIFLAAAELISGGIVDKTSVIVCFGGLGVLMWAYYAVMRILVKTGIEVEMLAFFLSAIGFSVAASSSPGELYKQFFAFILGFGLFVLIGWFLRDLKRSMSIKMYVMIFAVGLLFFNLIFGQTKNGAKNWISIGGISLQPSELVKIAFIFIGAATLDVLLTRKNLAYFIGFSGVCIGALALMGDFGTAAIFFVAFIVIAFMRSGDFATIALICATVVFGIMLVLKFKPYVARRFSIWGHAWDDAYDLGYQQTRTMSAAASGGVFGVGVGNGWLRQVVAADTDLVFGVVCEEWGLIIAIVAVLSICALAAFTVKSAANGRSSFYVIGACAAVSMMVFQTILNTLGSVDLLPLTGVTFPFVSNGGSSMLSSWGLLAYVKAADTRRNASFAATRENFKVRIQSGQPLPASQETEDSEIENKIGRSEYDFSKLGQIAERIRVKLIDAGIIKPVEDIDFTSDSNSSDYEENIKSESEQNAKKVNSDNVISRRAEQSKTKKTIDSDDKVSSDPRLKASESAKSNVKQSETKQKAARNNSAVGPNAVNRSTAAQNTARQRVTKQNTTGSKSRKYTDNFDDTDDGDSYIGKRRRY